MPAAGSATVLREDGPALLPVEEEREEIDMGKITITEKQEAIIRRLNDPLYTVEFLKEWVNRCVRGRLRFTDEEGKAYAAAPFPSMVVIYNGKRR